ncbi:MAG: hypothetical protein IPM42_10110 [Saprospiraceae bacterium]|nr:hypothetical protein [Saprospiraceae bacterium]
MKYFKFYFVIICSFLTPKLSSAQSPHILRNDPMYHTFDRMDILKQTDSFMISSIGNFNRKETVNYFIRAWQSENLTDKDRYDLLHIFRDNIEFSIPLSQKSILPEELKDGFRTADDKVIDNESMLSESDLKRRPIWKHFYKTHANFLQLETPSFSVYVNPLFHFSFGRERDNDNNVFQNTRGLELRGYIDKKVYFFTQLVETQRSFLSFQNEWINKFNTVPGQGLYKSYKSTVIGSLTGYDYFNAKGYIGFNATKSINIELGHGNHFIGNGHRSLLLSDFSHNYFYLKFNTRIWKFQYQNIFAELAPASVNSIPFDVLLPKKFTATHYLGFAPNKNFEVGIFETVIFAREKVFEFQYLNPVILYRAVEHSLGSPDNVMLGLNLKWNFMKGLSFYGQMILDEFKLSELKDNTGWWANKYGFQTGLKYINVLGIDHLDAQIEYNTVRPYTYTHRDTLSANPNFSVANYSHNSQPLAHQLGANFKEWLFFLRYRVTERLNVNAKLLRSTYGDDLGRSNWGGNILLPHESREREYGNFTGQGISKSVNAFNLDFQHEFYHNFYLDLNFLYRNLKFKHGSDINSTYIGAGLRINIAAMNYDY